MELNWVEDVENEDSNGDVGAVVAMVLAGVVRSEFWAEKAFHALVPRLAFGRGGVSLGCIVLVFDVVDFVGKRGNSECDWRGSNLTGNVIEPQTLVGGGAGVICLGGDGGGKAFLVGV